MKQDINKFKKFEKEFFQKKFSVKKILHKK